MTLSSDSAPKSGSGATSTASITPAGSSGKSAARPHQSSGLFARDPSKAFFERFSLVWAPVSMMILLGGLLGTGLYTQCGRNEYLAVSILICLPGFVYPLLFPHPCDIGRPYAQRFWVKAAVWIAIFSFYGNYFWTHYFYTILGAEYLFDSYMLNQVPVVTYICTYFYFTFYFAFINVVLRALKRSLAPLNNFQTPVAAFVSSALWNLSVIGAAVGTAVFEAVSIQHFPLYTYKDRRAFLTLGSVFYGIYFMVGFPMFFVIDEDLGPSFSTSSATTGEASKSGTEACKSNDEHGNLVRGQRRQQARDDPSHEPCSLWYVAQNALAAVAIVTLGLDLWRLFLGDIYSLNGGFPDVPFISQRFAPSPEPLSSYQAVLSHLKSGVLRLRSWK